MIRPSVWMGLALIAGLVLAAFVIPAGAAELVVSNERPKQGQTVEVTVGGEPPLPENAPAIEFNKQRYKLFAVPSGRRADSSQPAIYVAIAAAESDVGNDPGSMAEVGGAAVSVLTTLIAIPADLAPGQYALRYGDLTKKILVQSAGFPVQRLRLSKQTAALKPSPGEAEAVAGAKTALSADRQWSGRFTAPVKARVTAGFGLRRVVNGKLLSDYFHSGIDYAAPLGEPVRATAPGKVILAATGFRLHGNTICLDHGQGVVSFYIHLQKVLVKPGQVVEAGRVIGKVGQSGRASGPHLHFSVYVQQVAANPWYWFSQSF